MMSEEVKFSSFKDYFTNFCPHIMFYGKGGTGKTTLAGKTGMRTILLDCGDSGVVTLKDVDKKLLRIIKIRSILHYLDAINDCVHIAQQGKVDLLVSDTLTGLRALAIREVKGKRNFDGMNIKKWGMVSSRVIECIHETSNFPRDVIYLAQQKKSGELGEDDSTKRISSDLSDGVQNFLSGRIDWIGNLFMDDERRKISFLISERLEAKDRSGLFPKVLTLGPQSKDVSPYIAIRKRIVESIHG